MDWTVGTYWILGSCNTTLGYCFALHSLVRIVLFLVFLDRLVNCLLDKFSIHTVSYPN